MRDFFGYQTAMALKVPARARAIHAAERSLGIAFPPEYRRLLQAANGFVGDYLVGNMPVFLVLYQVEELSQVNNGLQAQAYQPGALIIGSNGGDEKIGIDMLKGAATYGSFLLIPFIMNWDDTYYLGKTVEAFLQAYPEPRQ